jgi:hypothetical protein
VFGEKIAGRKHRPVPFLQRKGDGPIFATVNRIHAASFLSPRKSGQSPVNAYFRHRSHIPVDNPAVDAANCSNDGLTVRRCNAFPATRLIRILIQCCADTSFNAKNTHYFYCGVKAACGFAKLLKVATSSRAKWVLNRAISIEKAYNSLPVRQCEILTDDPAAGPRSEASIRACRGDSLPKTARPPIAPISPPN